MKSIKWIILLAAIITVITSCKKDDDKDNNIETPGLTEAQKLNGEIRDLMREVYLWYDVFPVQNIRDYDNPYDYMAASRYNPPDSWSFVITTDDYYALFKGGSSGIGYGISLGVDDKDRIRIVFLYNKTDAYANGVRRGWIIDKVNGTKATSNNVFTLISQTTNDFEFINHNSEVVNMTLTKSDIEITPVMHNEVIEYAGKKVGYMVFSDFLENAYEPLDTAFQSLYDQNIDELIIDLRYNGGGASSVAQFLISHLLDNATSNDVFTHYSYNDKYSEAWDSYEYFMEPGDTIFRCDQDNNCDAIVLGNDRLSLSRIFFITTDGTASASEMVINGLKPYLGDDNVIVVGENTHGKPVGMNGFADDKEDYLFFPITFSYDNANGEGDFYEGIPVDYVADDDYRKNWGDVTESSLSTVLNIIAGKKSASGAEPMDGNIIGSDHMRADFVIQSIR